ncbi:MAG TPA: SDR family NAD(P)-dependent oxidoreductase [Myxococcota bacterium]|nr:SDR family NAD(P)-dependent oxidoreductase [Myxococcota bacterium]
MSDAFAKRYGPWSVVLGAAQGIGFAFAEELARRGLSVMLIDLRADLLEAAGDRVRAANPAIDVETAQLDLAAPDVAAQLRAVLGRLDVGLAVYTAMLPLAGAFLSRPLEQHEAAVGVGVNGVLAASHVLGERLVKRGRGGLILTSSLAGYQGTAWVAEYAAAKAFDLVLAEGLWWEWREHGVDVVALCPGNTATPGLLSNKPLADPKTFANPADVACEALDHLPRACEHGPVCIPGEDNRAVRAAFDKLPRKQVVELIGASTKQMFAG